MPKRVALEPITVCEESPPTHAEAVSRRAVTAALAGMASAWIAAGSLGLVSQPLRNGLLWLALGTMLTAAWPTGRVLRTQWALLALAVLAALALAVPATPVGAVFGVACVGAVLARLHSGMDRQILLLTTVAITVLGIFRLALICIPTIWSLFNLFGNQLGQLAAALSGQPLRLGATFAGLELLVPMAVFYAGWLRWTAPPRRGRAVYGATAILVAHLGYLVLLAFAADFPSWLPAPISAPPDPYLEFYSPPDWQWSQALAAMLPWNLLVVAGLLDLAILALMFRWSSWTVAGPPRPASARFRPLVEFGPPVLAVLLPMVVVLAPHEPGLSQRKIVAYDQGYLDWEKPVHDVYGRQAAGMYGMLPQFVETLGGQFVRSAQLAPDDLRNADVLLLLHPNRMWPKEQLRRVWQYVRDGGSLLLVTGPGVQDDQMAATVNQVLEPCAMTVRFDTAVCPIPGWQHSLEVLPHPATAGIDDRHNRFGLVESSSIRTTWPARPLLVGRYGWSDPGPDTALNMAGGFDAGEPLGDLVLAAEQPLGRGTIVVLADAYGLTNEGTAQAFPFTARLLSYLAGHAASPQSAWRQALGIVVSLLLIGLLFWRFDPSQAALIAVGLGMSLVIAQSANGAAGAVLPDGQLQPPIPVAYIDASHLGAYNERSWHPESLDGLKLTLMRNGYLPLMAPDLTPARLHRAELLISIAPACAFSESERRTIRQFVEDGGIFISMAGATDAGASQSLLADFDFRIPPTTLPAIAGQEARHERHIRSAYLDPQATGGRHRFVWFEAAWPIECNAPDATIISRDFDSRPILAVRKVGRGKVVVIGDSGFALNKNLEDISGESFAGGYENAHFWRWFLADLRGQPAWIPPEPPQEQGQDTLPSDSAAGAASKAKPPRQEKRP